MLVGGGFNIGWISPQDKSHDSAAALTFGALPVCEILTQVTDPQEFRV